jgi:hypothetical protein
LAAVAVAVAVAVVFPAADAPVRLGGAADGFLTSSTARINAAHIGVPAATTAADPGATVTAPAWATLAILPNKQKLVREATVLATAASVLSAAT